MANTNITQNTPFLAQVERVKEELRSKFGKFHDALVAREAVLLSELDELAARYKTEGVKQQIQDLNKMIETLKSTAQHNENQEAIAQSIAPLEARIRELEISLKTAKDKLRGVELEWDGELEKRLSELGGIRVIGHVDYKKMGNPFLVACKHSFHKSTEVDTFCLPRSLAIEPKSKNVYVVDSTNSRVQVFNSSLNYQYQFGEKMDGPRCICFDGGKVYVTQMQGNCLTVYTIEGKFLDSVGGKGERDLEFEWPRGVVVSRAKNLIYVCDYKNNRIQCLNLSLTFNTSILNVFNPKDIKLTENAILVLKKGHHCIIVFNHSHQFVREMIRCGEGTILIQPFYFCLDEFSNIIMSDVKAHCVAIFSKGGDFIHNFGKEGMHRGEFMEPTGIALNSENRIIVVSHNSNNCIQVF